MELMCIDGGDLKEGWNQGRRVYYINFLMINILLGNHKSSSKLLCSGNGYDDNVPFFYAIFFFFNDKK